MLYIYSYKMGSKSAKELKESLGAKLIKHKNSKFKPAGKKVINWGSSSMPKGIVDNAIIINHPTAVCLATNKLKTFNVLADTNVRIPKFTTDKAVAAKYIQDGQTVFCRTKLTGNSGDGIVIASTVEQLVDAPLYTVWERIKNEYRIHVFRGQVIDKQRKARKLDVPDDKVNWKVRNLDGGFIFARGDCNPEQGIEEAAINAVAALGLDFGAVDIAYTKGGKVMLLEVNTACGLMNTTLEKYTKAFLNI